MFDSNLTKLIKAGPQRKKQRLVIILREVFQEQMFHSHTNHFVSKEVKRKHYEIP